jgi:hypothetical protein
MPPKPVRERREREEISPIDLVDAIVPKELPTGERSWPWKTRMEYMRWLLRDQKTEPHVRRGVSLANRFMTAARKAGLSVGESREALLEDPDRLMEIVRTPITFRPSVRLGLMKAGADIWEEVRKAGAEESFREVNIDRELMRYATVKVYSKTKADGSISAGSGVQNAADYGLYAWSRDGGLVLDKGVDLAFLKNDPALIGITERQVDYFIEAQESDGHWRQRYAIHTADWEQEDTKRSQDRMWAEPQKDGTAAVLSALVRYVDRKTDGGRRATNSDIVKGSLKAIGRAVGYLLNDTKMTWDAWEERFDYNFHTEAHIIKALRDAHSIRKILFKGGVILDVEALKKKADAMEDGLGNYLQVTDADRADLERFLGRKPRRDESWVKEYKSFSGWYYIDGEQDHGPINSLAVEAVVEAGVLPLDSRSVLGHIMLMDELSEKDAPKINDGTHPPLWIRYPGDIFDPDPEKYPPRKGVTRGRPWSITTMWAAQHGYMLARKYLKDGEIRLDYAVQAAYINKALGYAGEAPLSIPPAREEDGLLQRPIIVKADDRRFEKAVSGLWGWADRRLLEITKRFNPTPNAEPKPGEDFADRRIPEEYDPETGGAYKRGEQSLTWAYREFVKAVETRLELYRDWVGRKMPRT